jgi:hypothetical protein
MFSVRLISRLTGHTGNVGHLLDRTRPRLPEAGVVMSVNDLGTNPANDLEAQKLLIEREKLEIEKKKLAIEHSNVKWAAFSSVVPLLAIIATIAFGLWSQREQQKMAFQMEIVKGIVEVPDEYRAINRIKPYNAIFPDQLPKTLVVGDLPEKFWQSMDASPAQDNFMKLISDHGLNPVQTAELWSILFPTDEWAADPKLLEFLRNTTKPASSPATK